MLRGPACQDLCQSCHADRDATIAFTFDVYGHLMPGGEDEARERIDGYLDRLDGAPHLRAVGE